MGRGVSLCLLKARPLDGIDGMLGCDYAPSISVSRARSRRRFFKPCSFWLGYDFGEAYIGPNQVDFRVFNSDWSPVYGRVAMGAIAGGTFTGKLTAAVVAATAGAVAVRLPKAILRVVATLIIAIALAIHAERQNQREVAKLLRTGEKESYLIQAFHTLNLRPKPGCRILLVENPFADAPVGGPWYPLFIATLIWHDHSLTIYQEGLHELNARQIANMDYILAVHEHKVDVLRQP